MSDLPEATPPSASSAPPALAPPPTALPDLNARFVVDAIGQPWAPWKDAYHLVLTRTWPSFMLFVALTYVGVNGLFATLYALVPGCLANARPGSFEDAFYFSVQTLATIGYGGMMPATRYAHLVVIVEALVGILFVALVTGMTFARFSRPATRVLFTNKIAVTPRVDGPVMLFRMANERHNQIIEAQLKVIILVNETTSDGMTMRRPLDVKLVRTTTPMFALSWTAMHRIDEASPFHGPAALERLRKADGQIYLTLTGYDETIAQNIHARYGYALEDIVWNARFADVLTTRPDGTRSLDYTHFHETVAVEPPVAAPT